MRRPGLLGTVCIVSSDHPAAKPLRRSVSKRQWLVTVVLASCAATATLALLPGPAPRGPVSALLLACVVCGPIVLLRRWLLSIPPMPAWAMITVIAGWIVGWSVIGARRMATRDA